MGEGEKTSPTPNVQGPKFKRLDPGTRNLELFYPGVRAKRFSFHTTPKTFKININSRRFMRFEVFLKRTITRNTNLLRRRRVGQIRGSIEESNRGVLSGVRRGLATIEYEAHRPYHGPESRPWWDRGIAGPLSFAALIARFLGGLRASRVRYMQGQSPEEHRSRICRHTSRISEG